ncbi:MULTISPECIES: DUF3226 domain-containing protein [unclassified Coleofasciculus]|uniref:DUF3226 domain-containing protein n=1 Tax=unclassified Coleofasciculus TaxID=2692782 RepID=UPI001882B3C0|nr:MULTISPECIES: DUF3226 domain-containing protein [unclassified Coleofasciculus]MBE9125002.1 hypothetical protein [Coleofasciculus sp. LEGE 07081]MBE9147678.1 hypothetical protein [Coleofasciculus sp. LEGE 07092]
MPKKPKPHQLLVEGKNDRHVIWALCNQYQLPETFSVEVAEEKGTEGIEALLAGLPARIDEPKLQTLGIVVDADQDLRARWQAVRNRLMKSGYQTIPTVPPPDGWVYTQPDKPKIGFWLMPDNQVSGMLEDFVTLLIPTDDSLRPKAEAIVQEIEQFKLNRYTPIHHSKALIHTWLAWQETPGMPMGQAITAQVLSCNAEIANKFVEWLKRLFELADTSE